MTDYDSTSRDGVFADKEKQHKVNEVILQHLNTQGRLDLSNIVADEAGLGDLKIYEEPFKELNAIVESLKQRNLGPALHWAACNRRALDERAGHSIISHHRNGRAFVEQHSSLEMKLHRMQFVELLRQDSPNAASNAVAFARAHFFRFVDTHEQEIQQLMGAIMYAQGPGCEKRLRTSPYAHLLDEANWDDIKEHFVRNACLLIGLSVESPLSIILNAGCTALPALLNIKQVMQQRQVGNVWSNKDELPIEIDLGPGNHYHSLFACPILRHQTTDANPPVRLQCGHVISRDALTKLTSGHKLLKCPYCPVESNPADARQITF